MGVVLHESIYANLFSTSKFRFWDLFQLDVEKSIWTRVEKIIHEKFIIPPCPFDKCLIPSFSSYQLCPWIIWTVLFKVIKVPIEY